MQACIKPGSNIKQIILKSECIKYEIVKTPAKVNIFLSSLFNPQKLTSNTVNQHIIRGNYSIVSGPFCSTFLRHFSTIYNSKRENELKMVEKIQNIILNKRNCTKKESTNLNSKMVDIKSLKNLLDFHVNDRKLLKTKFINSKHDFSSLKLYVLNQNLTEKLFFIHSNNQSLKLLSRLENQKRNLHSCINVVLNEEIQNLPSITHKTNSVINYQPPENKISKFIKYYHDWKTPDFSYYRMNQTLDPNVNSSKSVEERKLPTVLIYTAFGLASAYGIKSIGTHYVMYLAPSAEVLALARVEIKLTDIVEGRSVTFKWRGKPLFIKHRTDAQIETERNVDITTLRDPQRDEERCKDPKWLIVIGVCTHLGCVPISNAGDFPGGYYCPCHGSHFDGSGRVRKGPAPLNLEVPQYKFDGDIVIVG